MHGECATFGVWVEHGRMQVKTAEMGKHHTSCIVASVLKRPILAPRGRIYLFYSIKKKFCPKCFDPYPKSCAFAMRSCSTKYGLTILSSRRAIRDNIYSQPVRLRIWCIVNWVIVTFSIVNCCFKITRLSKLPVVYRYRWGTF